MRRFGVAQRCNVVESAVANLFRDSHPGKARIACAPQIMRRRYFLMPRLGRRSFQALGEANHCNGQGVPVDWTYATEAGREEELAVAAQLNCALDGFNRQGRNQNEMVALIFCPLTRDEPSSTLRAIEMLKFSLMCTGDFSCSRCSEQRKP